MCIEENLEEGREGRGRTAMNASKGKKNRCKERRYIGREA